MLYLSPDIFFLIRSTFFPVCFIFSSFFLCDNLFFCLYFSLSFYFPILRNWNVLMNPLKNYHHIVRVLNKWAQNKDASYETAVASEKRDSKEQNSPNENDSNGQPKFCDFADDDANGSDEMEQLSSSPPPPSIVVAGSPRQSLFTSTPDKEKRRRSSAWQTKIERRRRKNSSNHSSISSSVVDDSDIDDLNGSSIGELGESPPNDYSRQKRHSWWNIFVPDNIKQRYINIYTLCRDQWQYTHWFESNQFDQKLLFGAAIKIYHFYFSVDTLRKLFHWLHHKTIIKLDKQITYQSRKCHDLIKAQRVLA